MRSLVKGYGDTHERGRAKFEKLATLVPRLRGQDNSGARLEGLVKAALADEGDEALDQGHRGSHCGPEHGPQRRSEFGGLPLPTRGKGANQTRGTACAKALAITSAMGEASGPIPKFATTRSTYDPNFGIQGPLATL